MSTIDHMPGPYSIALAISIFGVIVSFFCLAIYFLIRNRNQ